MGEDNRTAAVRGCRFESQRHEEKGEGLVLKTVHLNGRKADAPRAERIGRLDAGLWAGLPHQAKSWRRPRSGLAWSALFPPIQAQLAMSAEDHNLWDAQGD